MSKKLVKALFCQTRNFEPEVGPAWNNAWTKAGECNGALEPTVSPPASPTIPFDSLSNVPSVMSSKCSSTNAVFDSNYGVPRCECESNSCDTGSLLVGRGEMDDGVEPNLSNT